MWKWTMAAALLLLMGASTPVERRLYPTTVEASSFLWNDWNRFQENYHPLYLVDEDPKTAWVEGHKGSGAGEWVRLAVTPMQAASGVRLRIRNGYQKTARLFAANARAKELVVKLLPSGQSQVFTLKDAADWQEMRLAQSPGPLTAVELFVQSVYEGKKYKDLCLSDVQVFVTAETPENPAFEKAKHDRVQRWKGERKKTAQLFAGAAKASMPILPQYELEEVESEGEWREIHDRCDENRRCYQDEALKKIPKQGHEDALALARAALSFDPRAWTAVQVVSRDKRPVPRVDGLQPWGLLEDSEVEGDSGRLVELPVLGTLSVLNSTQLATFDLKVAQPPPSEFLAHYETMCRRQRVKTYAWALREKTPEGAATLRALELIECGEVPTREGTSPAVARQLAIYDRQGRLELLVGDRYATVFTWGQGSAGPLLLGARRADAWGKVLVLRVARDEASR
jgi:hypothetical protein